MIGSKTNPQLLIMAKILFIGDVIGKPGRRALREVLPQCKEEYKPDVTIVNVENLAHGKGVTPITLAEVDALGVYCFTSGNHIFKKNELSTECFEKYPKLIRPGNYPENLPGHGYYRFAKDGQQYLILNLNGQVFFDTLFDGAVTNPFFALDKILEQQAQKGDIILLDFHAEATSEKIAMGWHSDGKITAMVGTHTHVPTADARILPGGTAYLTDAGMTGPINSIIGVKIQNSLNMFLEKGKFIMEPEEDGPCMVNGLLVETNDQDQAIKIEKLYQEVS